MGRVARRLWYATAVAAVVVIVTGLAVAAITLSQENQNAVGNYTHYNGAVTGLSYTSTVAGSVPGTAPSASSGTALLPQAVVAGANVFCATSCIGNHLALNVTYTFDTTMAGSIQITLQVTAGSGSGSSNIYVKQALLPVSGTIVLVWDVGTSRSTLTDATITIHQCSGVTCP